MTTGGTGENFEQPRIGATFASKSTEADGFSVKYFEAGAGDPLVVLHGANGPRMSLALDWLAERFHVYVVEMPGWGDQVNNRTRALEDLADSVALVLEQIGLESFHLLGTALGGATALRLATRHPERITSLVLESPSEFRQGALAPSSSIAPDALRQLSRAHPERLPQWEMPKSQTQFSALVSRLNSGPEYDEELAARLVELPVNTLVLFGEYDGVIPLRNGSTYRRLIPNCSFQIVADAAHDIQGDRPEAFVDIVSEFLERGMAFLLSEADTLINP